MEKFILYIVKIIYKINFINYLKKISKLLHDNITSDFTLLDIGAANGAHERWNIIQKKLNLILVEPHKKSAELLKKKKINVIESVLSKEDNIKTKFYITRKAECSSFLKPNFDHLRNFSNPERFDVISEADFNSKKLDTVINDFSLPNFIKIDTEGSELEILKGSSQTLKNTFGLEIECSFHQIRKDQPLFEEVRDYLKNMDFMFIDFVTIIRWEKYNFNLFGQPQITDALFLKNEETIIEKFNKNEINLENLINYFIILIAYERLDILIYSYKKTNLKLEYIERIIDILKLKRKKLNKLKQAQYFIEHQSL